MVKDVVKANTGLKRMFFFVSGIIATLAYRGIVVLNQYGKSFVNVAWYIGTVGFILYFGHRAHVQKKRAELVKENGLVKVISELKKVNTEQRKALNYLVKSVVTSRASWNSLFIFWLSILALIVGILIDFVF